MADPRRTLAHEWFEEVWNKGRGDAIAEMVTEETVAHGLIDPAGDELRGPIGHRRFFEAFKSAFPDLRVDVIDTVCEQDKIAARCEVHGTHTGDGIGVAPTNQPVSITGMTIFRIQDGKIAESWNNYDFQSMYAQLNGKRSRK